MEALEEDTDGREENDEVELDVDDDVDTDEGEDGVEQTADGNAEK